MKLLEIKDLQDKTTAIEAVAKLLKKKKGGKKTKKPKQWKFVFLELIEKKNCLLLLQTFN